MVIIEAAESDPAQSIIFYINIDLKYKGYMITALTSLLRKEDKAISILSVSCPRFLKNNAKS